MRTPSISLRLCCVLFTAFALTISTFAKPGLALTLGPGTAPVTVPTGGFGIEGNLQANVPTLGIGDWVPGAAGSGGSVLTAGGVPLSAASTHHLTDLFSSGSDNNFAGGLKFDDNPNSWTWVSNPVNDKTDINHGLLHFATDANNHVWVAFAADRLSNNGDAYIDFEFLQNTLTVTGATSGGFSSAGPNGGRTLNDFILTLSLTKGGSTAGFAVNRWESVGGGSFDYVDRTSLLPSAAVFAAVNTAVVPVSFGAFGLPNYDTNNFVEGAVDLSALLGAFDPCLSLGVKTILIKTKQSQSPAATITDFISPLQVVRRLTGVDAGPDQLQCATGSSTKFTVTGTVNPAAGETVSSITWSPISGSATIDSPNSLTTDVHVTSGPVTLRLTVVTSPHNCTLTDDVVLALKPQPDCSVAGPDPICPGAPSTTYTAPAGLASYAWVVTGDGSIIGLANQQTVKVAANLVCGGAISIQLTTTLNGCQRVCGTTVHLVDTTPPTIGAPGGPVTIQCPTAPTFTPPTVATDACDPNPTIVEVSDVTVPGSCAGTYDRTKSWKARDACGNLSTAVSQTIHVVDTTPPTIGPAGADANSACGTTPTFTPPTTASDACDAHPAIIEVGDVTVAGTCAGTYDRTKTWKAKDACGNLSSPVSQTIHVVDTTPPTSGAPGAAATIQCPTVPSFTPPTTASDACDANPTIIEVSDVTVAGTCAGTYDRTKTWKAKDACGNLSSPVSQVIHVVDTTPPVVSCPGDITRPACQNVVTWTSSANDNCAGVLTATCDPPSGSTFPIGTTTVTCSATDPCGNKGTCTFKVTIQPNAVCSIAGGEQPICEGNTAQLCGAQGDFSWTWTGPNSFTSAQRCINVGTAGQYTLVLKNLTTGCTTSCTRDLVVNPLPLCDIGGPKAVPEGGVSRLCGPTGNYTYQWNTGATTQCIYVSAPGVYTLVVTDAVTHCSAPPCSVTVTRLTCACALGYPNSDNLPRSAVDFNESEVLRAFDPGEMQCGVGGGTIKLWYNDEHALTLGVRRVIVKSASGTTLKDFEVTGTPGAPACVDHPKVGTTDETGDFSGNDVAAGGGRPLWPVLYLTDLTVNGSSSHAGDWQMGGKGIAPHRVCGTWKAAVRTVDKTRNPAVITVTPDPDPAKNNWNLSGGDTPPSGFAALKNEGYGAECSWNISELQLETNHTYRAQFIVHDGDQNKVGGDCGEACTTVQYLQGLDAPEAPLTPFQLLQNLPNPFRTSTTIRYSLAERSEVSLSILDLTGREVVSLVRRAEAGGNHSIVWRGTGTSGQPVPPGMYFYRLEAKGEVTGNKQQIRKMIMLK